MKNPFDHSNCLVLVGTEELAKQRWRQRLLEELGAGVTWNFHEFELDADTPAEDLLTCVKTLPMMAPFRLVWVRVRDKKKSEAWEHLKAAIPNISSKVRLVVELTALVEADRKALAGAEILQLDPPRLEQLPAYLEREAERRGARIDPAAARLLADLVGTDLMRLNSELEKLCVATGPNRAIDESDVEEQLVRARSFDIFELLNQIAAGQRSRALVILNKMIEDGDARSIHLYVLSMLHWHCRRLVLAHAMLARQAPVSNIVAELKIRRDQQTAFLKLVRSYSKKALVRLVAEIQKADVRMKTSGDDPRWLLEQLVIRSFLYQSAARTS